MRTVRSHLGRVPNCLEVPPSSKIPSWRPCLTDPGPFRLPCPTPPPPGPLAASWLQGGGSVQTEGSAPLYGAYTSGPQFKSTGLASGQSGKPTNYTPIHIGHGFQPTACSNMQVASCCSMGGFPSLNALTSWPLLVTLQFTPTAPLKCAFLPLPSTSCSLKQRLDQQWLFMKTAASTILHGPQSVVERSFLAHITPPQSIPSMHAMGAVPPGLLPILVDQHGQNKMS